MLKLLAERPFVTVMAVLLLLVLCYVAMMIGFQLMISALRILSWLVVKLDALAKWRP